MAYYAALSSLSVTLEQISKPVEQKISSLKEKASCLLKILEDSSQKSRLTLINHLEGRIRDASYEAEDTIESLKAGQALLESEEYMRQNMDVGFQGLEKIIDEFDSILDDIFNKIKDGRVDDLPPRNSLTAGSRRSVAGEGSTPVGLDDDLLRIKDRLTGSPSKLDVIAIVGMGGIGKTTLARKLYDDLLIEQRFDIRAWVVISQQYNLQDIFMRILDSMGCRGGDELHHKSMKEIGSLAEKLYKGLKGRRYLIVMDNAWDTKIWDEVRRYLPNDNNGSRIILTTRLSEVAIYTNSNGPIHCMSPLRSEASWNLLREKVFGKECCPSALENIGKKIAKNCQGLPLAIVVIAGLLSKGSKTQDYWEDIAENINSIITRSDDQPVDILSLSYNSLPHHIKPCFLYMGVFPEDYEIFISQLVKLWIAEGFIKPQVYKSLEGIAEDYLKDLVDRNLILVHKRNHNGGIKICIIHDLLRVQCIEKAQEDKFLRIMNSGVPVFPQGRYNQHSVSVHSDMSYCFSHAHDWTVRSLLYFFRSMAEDDVYVAASFRLLRVFNALNILFHRFPIEIVELVRLRYTCNSLAEIPTSISKRQNLQTLIICQGMAIIEMLTHGTCVPSNIWEMRQLRHLLFENVTLPTPIKGEDPMILENLQTLSGVKNFNFTRKAIEMMPNLKKLGILYVHDEDTKWSSYEFNNFVCPHQLETLKCRFVRSTFAARRALPIQFTSLLI